MHRRILFSAGIQTVLMLAASAELQNVTVGGQLRIYHAYYSEFFESNPDGVERVSAAALLPRPLGPGGLTSYVRADDRDNELTFTEQRTLLHVQADFTQDVSAYIEFAQNRVWGQDFASGYRTGLDAAGGGDGVSVYQGYIEARSLFGAPLQLRVGRQELVFGSGWLAGNNPYSDPYTGLSFDAIRLIYEAESFTVDAWSSKLFEASPIEQDGDVDFYGLYASYTAIEEMTFDAYWMLVRDAQSVSDTQGSLLANHLEHVLGFDDYGVTNLHTAGLRWAGARGAFDWEVEGAYQWGDASALGALFAPAIYGDDDAEWDTWGGHAEMGYTLDMAWAPRVYLGGHYYQGEDNRRLDIREWLNPFAWPAASISFNRLFSDYENDAFLDGSGLSNMWQLSAGATAAPTDKIEIGIDVTHLESIEAFDWPAYADWGRYRIPILPELAPWTRAGSTDLGWQYSAWCAYAYSEDLCVEVGATYYDVGEGLRDGAFIDGNGMSFVGSRGTDDALYLYSECGIEF